ncbi:TPA: hypothetical protein RU610_000348 [Salmonella enterica]|nr:hypothetical protein [Salmonella enterica]HEA0416414.1 hypothetical protein [Salmonella enterica]
MPQITAINSIESQNVMHGAPSAITALTTEQLLIKIDNVRLEERPAIPVCYRLAVNAGVVAGTISKETEDILSSIPGNYSENYQKIMGITVGNYFMHISKDHIVDSGIINFRNLRSGKIFHTAYVHKTINGEIIFLHNNNLTIDAILNKGMHSLPLQKGGLNVHILDDQKLRNLQDYLNQNIGFHFITTRDLETNLKKEYGFNHPCNLPCEHLTHNSEGEKLSSEQMMDVDVPGTSAQQANIPTIVYEFSAQNLPEKLSDIKPDDDIYTSSSSSSSSSPCSSPCPSPPRVPDAEEIRRKEEHNKRVRWYQQKRFAELTKLHPDLASHIVTEMLPTGILLTRVKNSPTDILFVDVHGTYMNMKSGTMLKPEAIARGFTKTITIPKNLELNFLAPHDTILTEGPGSKDGNHVGITERALGATGKSCQIYSRLAAPDAMRPGIVYSEYNEKTAGTNETGKVVNYFLSSTSDDVDQTLCQLSVLENRISCPDKMDMLTIAPKVGIFDEKYKVTTLEELLRVIQITNPQYKRIILGSCRRSYFSRDDSIYEYSLQTSDLPIDRQMPIRGDNKSAFIVEDYNILPNDDLMLIRNYIDREIRKNLAWTPDAGDFIPHVMMKLPDFQETGLQLNIFTPSLESGEYNHCVSYPENTEQSIRHEINLINYGDHYDLLTADNKIIDIPPGGNCFYHAIYNALTAEQKIKITGTPFIDLAIQNLRHRIADQILRDPSLWHLIPGLRSFIPANDSQMDEAQQNLPTHYTGTITRNVGYEHDEGIKLSINKVQLKKRPAHDQKVKALTKRLPEAKKLTLYAAYAGKLMTETVLAEAERDGMLPARVDGMINAKDILSHYRQQSLRLMNQESFGVTGYEIARQMESRLEKLDSELSYLDHEGKRDEYNLLAASLFDIHPYDLKKMARESFPLMDRYCEMLDRVVTSGNLTPETLQQCLDALLHRHSDEKMPSIVTTLLIDGHFSTNHRDDSLHEWKPRLWSVMVHTAQALDPVEGINNIRKILLSRLWHDTSVGKISFSFRQKKVNAYEKIFSSSVHKDSFSANLPPLELLPSREELRASKAGLECVRLNDKYARIAFCVLTHVENMSPLSKTVRELALIPDAETRMSKVVGYLLDAENSQDKEKFNYYIRLLLPPLMKPGALSGMDDKSMALYASILDTVSRSALLEPKMAEKIVHTLVNPDELFSVIRIALQRNSAPWMHSIWSALYHATNKSENMTLDKIKEILLSNTYSNEMIGSLKSIRGLIHPYGYNAYKTIFRRPVSDHKRQLPRQFLPERSQILRYSNSTRLRNEIEQHKNVAPDVTTSQYISLGALFSRLFADGDVRKPLASIEHNNIRTPQTLAQSLQARKEKEQLALSQFYTSATLVKESDWLRNDIISTQRNLLRTDLLLNDFWSEEMRQYAPSLIGRILHCNIIISNNDVVRSVGGNYQDKVQLIETAEGYIPQHAKDTDYKPAPFFTALLSALPDKLHSELTDALRKKTGKTLAHLKPEEQIAKLLSDYIEINPQVIDKLIEERSGIDNHELSYLDVLMSRITGQSESKHGDLDFYEFLYLSTRIFHVDNNDIQEKILSVMLRKDIIQKMLRLEKNYGVMTTYLGLLQVASNKNKISSDGIMTIFNFLADNNSFFIKRIIDSKDGEQLFSYYVSLLDYAIDFIAKSKTNTDEEFKRVVGEMKSQLRQKWLNMDVFKKLVSKKQRRDYKKFIYLLHHRELTPTSMEFDSEQKKRRLDFRKKVLRTSHRINKSIRMEPENRQPHSTEITSLGLLRFAQKYFHTSIIEPERIYRIEQEAISIVKSAIIQQVKKEVITIISQQYLDAANDILSRYPGNFEAIDQADKLRNEAKNPSKEIVDKIASELAEQFFREREQDYIPVLRQIISSHANLLPFMQTWDEQEERMVVPRYASYISSSPAFNLLIQDVIVGDHASEHKEPMMPNSELSVEDCARVSKLIDASKDVSGINADGQYTTEELYIDQYRNKTGQTNAWISKNKRLRLNHKYPHTRDIKIFSDENIFPAQSERAQQSFSKTLKNSTRNSLENSDRTKITGETGGIRVPTIVSHANSLNTMSLPNGIQNNVNASVDTGNERVKVTNSLVENPLTTEKLKPDLNYLQPVEHERESRVAQAVTTNGALSYHAISSTYAIDKKDVKKLQDKPYSPALINDKKMKENVLPMSKPQSFQYFQYDKSITEDEIKKKFEVERNKAQTPNFTFDGYVEGINQKSINEKALVRDAIQKLNAEYIEWEREVKNNSMVSNDAVETKAHYQWNEPALGKEEVHMNKILNDTHLLNKVHNTVKLKSESENNETHSRWESKIISANTLTSLPEDIRSRYKDGFNSAIKHIEDSAKAIVETSQFATIIKHEAALVDAVTFSDKMQSKDSTDTTVIKANSEIHDAVDAKRSEIEEERAEKHEKALDKAREEEKKIEEEKEKEQKEKDAYKALKNEEDEEKLKRMQNMKEPTQAEKRAAALKRFELVPDSV